MKLIELVSIHAPWEGCDFNKSIQSQADIKFQFTHPGKGATQSLDSPRRHSHCFNSRTLGRVRRKQLKGFSDAIEFQFTHPGKGATRPNSIIGTLSKTFQFTHPGKGATSVSLM